jgi:hypothetical protein
MCMSIEDELRAGLMSRGEALLDAATTCIYLAFTPPTDPSMWLRMIREAQGNLRYAEAMEAAILTRCGPSWDVLASRLEQTRQALHRRLGSQADERMRLAREREDMHEEQLLNWMDMLAVWAQHEAMETRPLEFYGAMAAELARLRKERQWWQHPQLIR